ncbi:hypothetical protein [Streptomyces albipurpureus]|uniref:Uncharacterized protein n=1 Tax=Streptomyces albipurpureus TaxID=2897419 RepID=A0ABT0V0I5_9ACTN|nr:hypothetical protein [Streptomyces sp. CWNU-1]MCM2394347.1 hypothetical protein [Streptomyces sp. CWNU-1]
MAVREGLSRLLVGAGWGLLLPVWLLRRIRLLGLALWWVAVSLLGRVLLRRDLLDGYAGDGFASHGGGDGPAGDGPQSAGDDR